MMQEDKYTDFDLQIRSMLQDAEEEVPSRVWDAVSGRIDRPKVVSLWWRRTAAGIAAAAVVALGVFLMPDRTSDTASPASAEVRTLAQASDVAVQTVPAVEASDSGLSGMLAEGAIDRPSAVRQMAGDVDGEKVAVENIDAGNVDAGRQVPSGEAASGSVVSGTSSESAVTSLRETCAKPSETVEEKSSGEEYRDDPFARMAYEDMHRRSWKGPLSGFVQGNVTSNEHSAKASGHMASEYYGVPTETGVRENSISTYGIPLSFGVGAKYRISEKWSVSAALTYSLLSRSFTGTYTEVSESGKILKSVSADINNNLHYIGIPVNVYYDVLNSNKVSFYAFGGFSMEKGLLNKYRIHSQPSSCFSQSVSGLQWSSALGLGIEFMLNDYLNLYIDPSARYYFDCDQPTSVRTQKPFMMNFEVGLRFDI